MASQTFALKLNTLLDRFNFPENSEDRENVFREYCHLHPRMAQLILKGMLVPRPAVIEKIAENLLVEVEELID